MALEAGARPTLAPQSVHPFAARPVALIAGVAAVAHVTTAVLGRSYWFDEVYMLAIGRTHLDWGSADQPPLVPALAAAMDWLMPDSVVVLRIPAIIATTTAVMLAGLIARELGGDSGAQALTALAQATAVWSSLTGHWLTPYSVEPVQWLLILWLVLRWMRVRDDRLLPVIGIAVGLAVMTKFQVLALCAVVLVAVALTGPRELMRRPLLWGAVGIGSVLAAPTLIWQARHGWPQLQMVEAVAGEAAVLYGGRAGIAVQLIVFAGVLGSVLMLYGLWLLAGDRHWRGYRWLAVAFVLLYVLVVVTEGRPYYLVGLYAPLVAVGAVGLQRRREAGSRRVAWLLWPVSVLSVICAGGIAATSTVLTDSDSGVQIAAGASTNYHSLPADQRQRTAVLGESYIIAAYLDGHGRRFDLPPAHSLSRAYGYFPPPEDSLDTALFIGADPGVLRPEFSSVERIAEVGDDLAVWLLEGRTAPWEQIWERGRTLTVS